MQHERAHGGSVAVQRGRTATAPLGYSIPAFPWYIDQTIGGAVATGSHGSTLRFGSVSSQARLPKPFPYMCWLRGGRAAYLQSAAQEAETGVSAANCLFSHGARHAPRPATRALSHHPHPAVHFYGIYSREECDALLMPSSALVRCSSTKLSA